MADFKLISIIGIHTYESFPDAAAVEAAWEGAVRHPAFVAAALYRGGHTAPLSGQDYSLERFEASRLAQNTAAERFIQDRQDSIRQGARRVRRGAFNAALAEGEGK